MPVFQALTVVNLRFGYDYFTLLEGQLVAANEPKIVAHLTGHTCFREITDDTLIKLAPPLYMIKPPQDPNTMRKEDIIGELRSYGIRVDPYVFSSQLSMQLSLARKLKKRNFLTVLNSNGQAVHIDRVNLPVPILSKNDEKLLEPADAAGEFYKITEMVPEDNYKKLKQKEADKKLPKDTAFEVSKVFDENELNEGQDFVDFCAEFNKTNEEEFKANIVKEQAIQELIFKPQPVIVDEKIIPEVPRLVSDSEITEKNYSFLIELSGGEFMLKPLKDEDFATIRTRNLMKRYNNDPLETFLRYHGIRSEYDNRNGGKRQNICRDVLAVLEKFEGKDKEWQIIYLNMLQKRYNEIEAGEPNFRHLKAQSLRIYATKTARYGMKTNYLEKKDNVSLVNYVMIVYQFMKLGLQIPETDEKTKEALIYHRRANRLSTKDPFHPRNFKENDEEDINNTDDKDV